MSLNCKPGELAVIVGAQEYPEHLGLIVRTVRLETSENPFDCGGMGWSTEPKLTDQGSELLILDADLRPIRPHGDDEQDESKAWLPPVPRTVTPTPCHHKDRSRV